MSVTMEIVLGIAALVLILSMAGGSMLLAFVILPGIQRRALHKRFPHVVPGAPGMRMNTPPVPSITAEDVGRGWKLFRARAVEKGYDGKKLDHEFSEEYVEFVRGVEGKRYIVDQYGRKIAGDRSGDVCRVVVIDGDSLASVACFHEWGHGSHATKGKVDYEHRDDIMWKEIVGWCKKEFAASS